MTGLPLFRFEINPHPVSKRFGVSLISAQLSDLHGGLEDQESDLTPAGLLLDAQL